MANPWHHAVSSSRKWGGDPEDYLEIHEWFDATKGWLPDSRHRAVRHHSEGVQQCVELFAPIRLSSGKVVPVRWVAEQHVTEDLGRIPIAADWLRNMTPAPWMTRARQLSVEQEQEDQDEEAGRAAEAV